MVKSLPKVLYYGAKILVVSVRRSIREEIAISRQMAKIRYQDNNAGLKNKENSTIGMTLDEAQKILNVNVLEPKEVQERFSHLFSANNKFRYLQSKVFRAKEVIDLELSNAKAKSPEKEKNVKPIKKNGKYLFATYILLTEIQ